MTNVVANFSNGKSFQIKNSKAAHKFAWLVIYEDKDGYSTWNNGFSSSKDGAQKAINAAAKFWSKKDKKYTAQGVTRTFEEIIEL